MSSANERSGVDARQDLTDQPLELFLLLPPGNPQGDLLRAVPTERTQVLHAFRRRARRRPRLDHCRREYRAVVLVEEALRFLERSLAIIVDVDVVIGHRWEALGVAVVLAE